MVIKNESGEENLLDDCHFNIKGQLMERVRPGTYIIKPFYGCNHFCSVYTIMILQRLSIYTSVKHSLLQTFETALALQSLDTLSDIRIKAFLLLF